ncbi:putative DCC family thiol-disulfide oxidoreductase YuxK [Murinocardiopsis flavida]|uniref:Putative DCC family thiol-disulfide oxidoreductase YuxK n=1 Tax=Murinocardiopsis flavida TaxID=645275 RepID=A0A2P8D2E1_9ACTN|nr:DUF393 domain-containing protein [Murinocardiopsis flavida]PSK91371.1 putative DCC family thiol-disulfide oxidoreductase YuxK [Murinocardiopsis flavida]
MPTPPVLIYDGDCGFCTRSVRFAERLAAGVVPVPWQATDLVALGTSEERARREVLLIEEEDIVYGGARAVSALLRRSRGTWRAAGYAMALPGIRSAASLAYRGIAANRFRFPGVTPACKLPREQRPGG